MFLHLDMLNAWLTGCRCVFVDIGLNDGASLMRWPSEALALLQKQSSSSSGAAARALRQCQRATAEACYIGIEPNPGFAAHLAELEASLLANGTRAKILRETALGVEDGSADLYVADNDGGVGSTLEAGKAHSFSTHGGRRWRSTGQTASSAYRNVTVRTLGAANFLRTLQAATPLVFVKLDVEGFEFQVLRSVLTTRPAALCRLSVLAIEWHNDRLTKAAAVPPQAMETLEWLMRGSSCGVELLRWH